MREVTTYYAYDDSEFYDRDECEEYESRARGWLRELVDAYSFFLDNGQEIYIYPGDDVDDTLYFIEYAFNKCARIRVKNKLSDGVIRFIYNYYGLIMPENECGLYEYNDNMREWLTVDE